MARALIVGCGCRGRMLGERLLAAGWAVRGTSRRAEGLAAIAAAGIEPARADPARPASVLELVGDVAVVHWLLGSATGSPRELAAIQGSSLERLLERLVETPVRGFVHEAGAEDRRAASLVRSAGERWRIRVAVVCGDPSRPQAWSEQMLAATLKLLGGAESGNG